MNQTDYFLFDFIEKQIHVILTPTHCLFAPL